MSIPHTAKNVILAGVKSVTIHDPDSVEMVHLSSQVRGRQLSNLKSDMLLSLSLSQFYFTEADIGVNCAAVSQPKLAELNSYVKVDVLPGAPTEEALMKFQVW